MAPEVYMAKEVRKAYSYAADSTCASLSAER